MNACISPKPSATFVLFSAAIVVEARALLICAPHSEPATCPGYTSYASGSSVRRRNEWKSPSAPSRASTARSGRAASPMNSESPVRTSRSSDDERAVLGAVSGGVHDADGNVADVQHLTVSEGVERVLGLGQRMNGDGQAVLEREPAMAGDVVGVSVRLEHAHDPHALLVSRLEVLVDCVRGVDHEGFAAGLVTDQVRGAAEIVVDELAEEHEREANSVCR